MWIAPPANRSFGIGATRWVSLNLSGADDARLPLRRTAPNAAHQTPVSKTAMSAAEFP